MKAMWEILVPTVRNDDRPIKLRFHKVWDDKVRAIAGGMIITSPIKGSWVDPKTLKRMEERSIPVRIACTSEQMDEIMDMTLDYYEQEAILAYKIYDEVRLRERHVK